MIEVFQLAYAHPVSTFFFLWGLAWVCFGLRGTSR
jgi:hypothetical protein